MDPITLGAIMTGGGLLNHFFGKKENPNEWAMGKANSMINDAKKWEDFGNNNYGIATKNYLESISKLLNNNVMSKSSLLGLGRANGLGYGTSSIIANQKINAFNRENSDRALSSTRGFMNNLYSMGLNHASGIRNNATSLYNLYGQGAMMGMQEKNDLTGNLLGLGLGLLGQKD